MRASSALGLDADTVEESLKKQLRDLPPGTQSYQLAHAELADYLLDQGREDEARQLYTQALLLRPASSEAATSRRQDAARQPGTADSRSTSESETEAWENGPWESDADGLRLGERLKLPGGPRVPNRQRPSIALFVPVAQQTAVAAKKQAAAAAAETGNGIVPPGVGSAASSTEPKKAAAPKRAPRSQLAKLHHMKADPGPRGLDPPGLADSSEPQHVLWDGRHVLEIMGVKATDGDSSIFQYLQGVQEFPIQPLLRWADESHALIVFSDVLDAEIALEKAPEIGRLWLRPYDQASTQCRQISSSELRPPTSRPKTSAVVAKRLLGNALHNRGLLDLAGEKEMRANRKERTAEKERRQKMVDDAWGAD